MVFFIKETLTAEDRAAWRRLAVRQDRATAKKHRAAVRERIMTKVHGLICVAIAAAGLFAVISGGLSFRMTPFAVLFLFTGGVMLFLYKVPEAKTPARLSGHDFPLSNMRDTPVRAVFYGDGCFTFWDASGKVRLGYQAVTFAWEDGGRFYLFFADRPPLVLPKRGLSRWMPEDFRDFLEQKLDVPVERMC